MTRAQGINLVNMYDNSYPEVFLDDYLKYYEISKKKFDLILDKWANKKLFKKKFGKWQPIFKII
jgi:hypothetical protein